MFWLVSWCCVVLNALGFIVVVVVVVCAAGEDVARQPVLRKRDARVCDGGQLAAGFGAAEHDEEGGRPSNGLQLQHRHEGIELYPVDGKEDVGALEYCRTTVCLRIKQPPVCVYVCTYSTYCSTDVLCRTLVTTSV